MTDINKQILELISSEKTLNQMNKDLNLSHRQIMSRIRDLENRGYEISKEYYYTGEIKYRLCTSIKDSEQLSIITKSPSSSIKYSLSFLLTTAV